MIRLKNAAGKLRLLTGPVLVVVVLLSLLTNFTPAAMATSNANFIFEPGVSEEDAAMAREGIRLAQDYFASQMDAPSDHIITVRVLDSSDDNVEVMAAARGYSIVVYAGSPVWQQSSPAERLATILHEYTHIYQFQMTGFRDFTSAAWFDEGLAEFISIDRLAELGIIDRGSIFLYEAGLVHRYAQGLQLSSLEEWEDYSQEGANAYPLAFFGVANLLADKDMISVREYYQAIADGADFDEAFETSFGVTPSDYYAEFESAMKSLDGSRHLPNDYEISTGIERQANVRVLQLPDLTSADHQSLIRAHTLPAALCVLTLTPDNPAAVHVARTTFADGDGDIFWLITIPPDWQQGSAAVTIDCGGSPVATNIQIATANTT